MDSAGGNWITTPWTATVWDPDTGNHSIRSLYGLHPGDSSFGEVFPGVAELLFNRGIDAIVRYILLRRRALARAAVPLRKVHMRL